MRTPANEWPDKSTHPGEWKLLETDGSIRLLSMDEVKQEQEVEFKRRTWFLKLHGKEACAHCYGAGKFLDYMHYTYTQENFLRYKTCSKCQGRGTWRT